MTASTPEATTVDLAEGSTLPEWTRETGLETWNRFAAVNNEFVSIHMDDEAGRAAGMPGAFGQGNLLVSYLHAAVRDWIGDHGRILELAAQFRKPNLRGRIIVGGAVTAVSSGHDGREAQLELWLKDADGAVLTPGTARVLLP